MKLEEYLEKLKTSPDEKLLAECGIEDNWAMFLNSDFEQVLRYFYESAQYKFHQLFGEYHRFDYVPGTVKLQVFDWVAKSSVTGCGSIDIERDVIESKKTISRL